jgi:hypothetical protein
MTLPAHLKNRRSQAVATEVSAGLGSAQPPHVSLKDNKFTLVDAAGNRKPVETTYLDCVIIDGQKGRSRTFWGVGAVYEGDNSGPPLCFSDNNVGPSINAQEPQAQTCAICPMARFDSDVSKKTGRPVPACKVLKKLAVMLPGFNFPFQLRVPVMSHAALATYSNEFKANSADVSDVITRVTFVGTGEIAFDFADYGNSTDVDGVLMACIDAATMTLRDDMLESKKTDVLVGRNDVPWSGALPAPKEQQALAPPKPAAQAAPSTRPTPTPQTPRPAFGAPGAAGEAPKRGRGRPANPKPAAPVNGGFVPAGGPGRDSIETSAPQSENPAPSFGIQEGAEPDSELSKALDDVFKLPT